MTQGLTFMIQYSGGGKFADGSVFFQGDTLING